VPLLETTNFSTLRLLRVALTATAPWMLDGHVHVHAVVPFWTKMTVNSIPLERLEIVGTTVAFAVVQETVAPARKTVRAPRAGETHGLCAGT
jgi:hypothetical protein